MAEQERRIVTAMKLICKDQPPTVDDNEVQRIGSTLSLHLGKKLGKLRKRFVNVDMNS